MDDSEFEGIWNEPQGTPHGELVWRDPGKNGLQTHVATVNGTVVGTIRKHLNGAGYSVRVTGWIWDRPAVGSVAERMGVGSTEVKGFPTLSRAKKAVAFALKQLPN